MKKIIALLVATMAVNVFADHHMRKMVTFDSNDLKHFFNWASGEREPAAGGAATETSGYEFQVNMAWELKSKLWVGGILGKSSSKSEKSGATTAESEGMKYGFRVVYDFLTRQDGSNAYAELRHIIGTSENKLTNTDTDTTETIVAVGYRCNVFKTLAGPHLNFSPSIEYSTGSEEVGAAETDTKETRLNLVKFDVIW